MNPGVVEEASKTAQHAITALNSVPVLLALVLLQFFILGGVMYLNIQRDNNVHVRFMKMIDQCTAANPRGGPRLQSGEDRPATPEEIERLFKIPP